MQNERIASFRKRNTCNKDIVPCWVHLKRVDPTSMGGNAAAESTTDQIVDANLCGIEARGVGLLVHPAQSGVVLAAVVDMGTEEKARLPERHIRTYLGVTLPCLHNADSPHFAAALLLYMKGGMKRFDD